MIESQDWVGSINKGWGHQEEETAKMNGLNDLNAKKKNQPKTAVLNLNFFFLMIPLLSMNSVWKVKTMVLWFWGLRQVVLLYLILLQ